MTLNIDCIRDILICLESNFTLNSNTQDPLNKYDSKTLLYHVRLLDKARMFVDKNDLDAVNILTARGEKLLAVIRDGNKWSDIKDSISNFKLSCVSTFMGVVMNFNRAVQ
ncbi:MAG: DUF2513 domain-containing protein [Sarcina sp.]